MKAIILISVLLLWMTGSVFAQAPDYPKYTASGQVSGTSKQTRVSSDQFGRLVLKANAFRSFHDINLESQWDIHRLRFLYKCIYMATNDALTASPTLGDGQPCPAGGSGNSRFVRAIKIELDGALKDDYTLKYTCTLAFFKQKVLQVLPQVDAGTYCGHETGGAPLEWIETLEIQLVHK